MAEDFYSVDGAARILKLTPGRIRQMLRAGEIEGGHPAGGCPGPLVRRSGRDIWRGESKARPDHALSTLTFEPLNVVNVG